jgi:hypothetical protein
MDETPPLFYLNEPTFGCSQPVHVGDLVRVKRLGYDWILEGKLFLVVGVSRSWDTGSMLGQDEIYDDIEEAHGIVDGVLRAVRIEDLELLHDPGNDTSGVAGDLVNLL